jgi:hypothetical protein
VTLIIFLVSQGGRASWFCREAASEAQGDHFYSCGVAKSTSLADARRKSLSNAKEEFRSFCKESKNCNGFEYTIKPLRTDCKKDDDKYICYRGLEYRILPTKKKAIDIDLDELNKEIKEKEELLKELQQKHSKIVHLNELNNNIEDFNKMDTLEVQIEDLEEMRVSIVESRKNNAGFVFSYINIPLSYDNESFFGLGAEYERFVIGNSLGIRLNVSYIMSTAKEDISSRGSSNSTSQPDFHGHKGVDLSTSTPIHIQKLSVAPKIGFTSIRYKESTKTYNNFGVESGTNESTRSYNKFYYGLGIRYQDTLFIEIEPRKYQDSNKITTSGSIGINIDF